MKRIQYDLCVKGVFGRNRKVKFETFPIADIPESEPMEEATLRALALAKVSEVKVKSGRVRVIKTPMEVREERGMQIKTFIIPLGVDTTVLDLGTI